MQLERDEIAEAWVAGDVRLAKPRIHRWYVEDAAAAPFGS